MSDYKTKDEQSIQELLRRKAELEDVNSDLTARLQDGEKIKSRLKEARRDSQKLLHHREKLKNCVDDRTQDSQGQKAGSEQISEMRQEELENSQDTDDKTEASPNVESQKVGESCTNSVPLKRALGALRIENSSLVKEKRKTEEQRDTLIQELVDFNTKHENLQSLCNKLKEEIERLSTFLGNSLTEKRSAEKEEDIEVLKAQLRLHQEEVNGMQARIEISEKSNERLRAELNEARAVIRDMRKNPPFEVYPAAVYQPIYRTHEDRYGYETWGYPIVRSGSGGIIAPMRQENRRPRTVSQKKNLFMPDLSAVVDLDREVEDTSSLISSKSF